MDALISALRDDPAVKWRRRVMGWGTAALVIVSLVVAIQVATRRRVEADRQISRQLEKATAEAGSARAKAKIAASLRQRAMTAFDALDRETGESFWRQARALVPVADREFDQAERAFEASLTLDQSRAEIRASLADVRLEHLIFAEEFRLGGKVEVLRERLLPVDTDGKRRQLLSAPARLELAIGSPGVQVLVEAYDRDPVSQRREPHQITTISQRQSSLSLAAGSYRLAAKGAGLAPVFYPFELVRGQTAHINLVLPKAVEIPQGYLYVPAGEFWFGDGEELLRSQFLGTVPIHRTRTDAFVIAKNETTYQEWIQFLEAIPPGARSRYLPNVSVTTRGSLQLRQLSREGEGRPVWQINFQQTTHRYVFSSG